MSDLLIITDGNFEEVVVNSDVPVLIDFWAVWCGPCKVIAPYVEELAVEYAGKVKVGKCDVDNNQKIALKHGIRSIPTLLIYKGGKVVNQIIGAVQKQQIKSKIEEAL